ncbi:MAG: hypothetical protein SGARI_000534, partial [Bacillariaceae sp.]
ISNSTAAPVPTGNNQTASVQPTPVQPSLTQPPSTSPPTTQAAQAPSDKPTQASAPTKPAVSPGRPVSAPTRQPSRIVDGGEEPTGNATLPSVCSFDPFEGQCVEVETFNDFETAIKEATGEVVFCGGFSIQRMDPGPLTIAKDVDIRCIEMCTVFGVGPLIRIGGAMSKVRFSNMKFMMARLDSAIRVSTMTSMSETTFCNSEFEGNNPRGKYGGAINIDERSGVVNVVGSTFTDNSASRGGAIFSKGFALNLIDSRFVANNAFNIGNAVFMAENSRITVESSTFLLNRLDNTGSGPLSQDYVIAIEPTKSIRAPPRAKSFIDAGKNRVIMSGDCDGFFNLWDKTCAEFAPILS